MLSLQAETCEPAHARQSMQASLPSLNRSLAPNFKPLVCDRLNITKQ